MSKFSSKTIISFPSIWNSFSCLGRSTWASSLRRIDPSWGRWKSAGDTFLQTAELKRLSGAFLLLSVRLKHTYGPATEGRRLTGSMEAKWRWSESPMGGRQRGMVTGGKLNLTFGVRRCCHCVTQYPILTGQGSAHNTSNMFFVQKKCQIMRFFSRLSL